MSVFRVTGLTDVPPSGSSLEKFVRVDGANGVHPLSIEVPASEAEGLTEGADVEVKLTAGSGIPGASR